MLPPPASQTQTRPILTLPEGRGPPAMGRARVRALGFEPPEITHMDSVTFLDVVAFNQILSERALFHALVHAVQFDILGLERYAELWVRRFLKNRTHFTVPLEVHAFTLTSKFLQSTADSFSVEDHVVRWLVDDRY